MVLRIVEKNETSKKIDIIRCSNYPYDEEYTTCIQIRNQHFSCVVELPDEFCGIDPQAIVVGDNVLIGYGFSLYCLKQTECSLNKFYSCVTPFYEFMVFEGLIMAICECEIILFDSALDILGEKCFDDILGNYTLVDNVFEFELFEGEKGKIRLDSIIQENRGSNKRVL